MMVIGDSLGQGCRSFTVTNEFCSECYGAIIAKALKQKFVTPKYPKPVIWHLEDILSQIDIVTALGQLPGILGQISNNIKFWAGSSWASNKVAYHDNVATTGSNLNDVITYDSNYYSDLIAANAHRSLFDLALNKDPNKAGIVDLFVAIVGRFALNPSNDLGLADMTQLKWVDRRKPKYLFVEIGHNGGDSAYFGSASSGEPIAPNYQVTSNGFCKDRYVRVMKLLIGDLLQLEAGAPEKIFIGLLPKMSAVSNLEPQGGRAGTSDYFDFYVPAINFNHNRFTAAEMAAADQAVAWANQQLVTFVAQIDKTNRIELIDTYALFAQYDYKHGRYHMGPGQPVWVNNLQITNEYITGRPIPSGIRGTYKFVFDKGGFEGVDGCHPSAVGYAVYALEVLGKLGPVSPDMVSETLTAAVKNEWLLKSALSKNPAFDPPLSRIDVLRHLTGIFTGYTDEDVKGSTLAQVLIASHSVGMGQVRPSTIPRQLL
jgi:lysophospholipase L1-like esterase